MWYEIFIEMFYLLIHSLTNSHYVSLAVSASQVPGLKACSTTIRWFLLCLWKHFFKLSTQEVLGKGYCLLGHGSLESLPLGQWCGSLKEVLDVEAWRSELNLWILRKGGGRGLTPQSCPLTSTCTLWHACLPPPPTHTKRKKLKKSAPGGDGTHL